MNEVLRIIRTPKIGLLMFPKYDDIIKWLRTNYNDISIDTKYDKQLQCLTFPNDARLYLGYGTDVDKYISTRFDFVLGTTDRRFLALVRL